jgi:hypothetical protein
MSDEMLKKKIYGISGGTERFRTASVHNSGTDKNVCAAIFSAPGERTKTNRRSRTEKGSSACFFCLKTTVMR